MSSQYQKRPSEDEDGGNLMSKVLNGMKSVFNADLIKKSSPKKAAAPKSRPRRVSVESVAAAPSQNSESAPTVSTATLDVLNSEYAVLTLNPVSPSSEPEATSPIRLKIVANVTNDCIQKNATDDSSQDVDEQILRVSPEEQASDAMQEIPVEISQSEPIESDTEKVQISENSIISVIDVSAVESFMSKDKDTNENASIPENSDVVPIVKDEKPVEGSPSHRESRSDVKKKKKAKDKSGKEGKLKAIKHRKPSEPTNDNNYKNEKPVEDKPRIVLKFRSEKSGLRKNNMKIVSDNDVSDVKATVVSRRSLRGNRQPMESSPKEEKKKRKSNPPPEIETTNYDNKSVSNVNSESDDGSKISKKKSNVSFVPSDSNSEDSTSIKRSARSRPKDFSDNILANAIARKEKSFEGSSSSSHTRLSRRIKPTAKILANKELRKGLETQNNVRLGLVLERIDMGEEGKLTRSKAKKPVDKSKNSEQESAKIPSNEKPKKKIKKTESSSSKFSDNDTLNKTSITTDEINQCIFGADYAYSQENSSVKIEGDISQEMPKLPVEDVNERRLNKIKRKHLKKLGLTAVTSSQNRDYSKDDDVLTDESTMDSINTEAIVEHLNNRDMVLDDGSAQDEYETPEAPPSELPQNDSSKCEKRSDTKKQTRNAKRKYSVTDTEESQMCSDIDEDEEIPVRMTRKRSRVECANISENNDPAKRMSTEKDDEVTSVNTLSCFCTAQSNFYADPSTLTGNDFCRAVETIGNRTIGCGRPILNGKLVRAGPRAQYFVACEMHHCRLSMHHCCASCGVFCTQGVHYQCSEGHLFHWECSLPFVPLLIPTANSDQSPSLSQPNAPRGTLTDVYNSVPGCPHCGLNPDTMEPKNLDCHKVNLEMQCSTPMVLLPNPRLQWLPARMSFVSRKHFTYDEASCDDRPENSVLPPDLLNTLKSSIDKINLKNSAPIDYDDLLIKVNGEVSKDMGLIKAVCDKENTIDNIIDAINSGCDPKGGIPHVDNGTFLHLAARELNLSALHIFKTLGCELDALDGENRTPLMLAVMNFDTELIDAKEDNSSEGGSMDGENKVAENSDRTKDSAKGKELVGNQKEYRMVIDYLLKAGSDVSLKGPNSATILHLAAKYGDLATCSTILNKYAQCFKSFINQKDDGGWTPLVWAVENKRNVIVRYLLDNGADPTLRDSENNVALHWAAMAGCSKIMEDLLNFGSQVNVINLNGDTPLHLCARQNHYNCLMLLLARGAQINVKNSEGETPLNCAMDETSDCFSALTVNAHLQKFITPSNFGDKIVSQDISNGKETNPIRCINAVDKEDLDGQFVYVTKNCYTVDINIDRKISSMQGCQCKDSCGQSESGCPCANLSMQCWYDSEGKLVSNFDYADPPMIFECNDACSCNKMRCINRGLDRGAGVTLKVFRQRENTARGGGWAVSTMQPIARGTLVSEYVGEILPANLAYHRNDDSYLFELEMKDDLLEETVEPYCIDARRYGNVSRFINHKCDPNLVPVRVFVDHRDLHFPRIAFFACKDIEAGEELGFDYGPKFWDIKIKTLTCHCKSDLCRYSEKDAAKHEIDSENEE